MYITLYSTLLLVQYLDYGLLPHLNSAPPKSAGNALLYSTYGDQVGESYNGSLERFIEGLPGNIHKNCHERMSGITQGAHALVKSVEAQLSHPSDSIDKETFFGDVLGAVRVNEVISNLALKSSLPVLPTSPASFGSSDLSILTNSLFPVEMVNFDVGPAEHMFAANWKDIQVLINCQESDIGKRNRNIISEFYVIFMNAWNSD